MQTPKYKLIVISFSFAMFVIGFHQMFFGEQSRGEFLLSIGMTASIEYLKDNSNKDKNDKKDQDKKEDKENKEDKDK